MGKSLMRTPGKEKENREKGDESDLKKARKREK